MSTMLLAPNLGCEVNMPAGLKGDKVHALPPYNRIPAYNVDEFPACPENWMRGTPTNGSYFIGVEEGKGLWLDFNSCNRHTHDVAVLISVQGINPITGKPLSGPKLEQYTKDCPVHGVPFQSNHYCPECDYKWPAQNYLATTGCSHGRFWLDGFRGEDGEVRQYLITKEVLSGIAAQVLGDVRVFAIGISFFLSKAPKPQVVSSNFLRGNPFGADPMGADYHSGPKYWGGDIKGPQRLFSCKIRSKSMEGGAPENSRGLSGELRMCADAESFGSPADFEDNLIASAAGPEPLEEVTKLEIAGGARISQAIDKDPKPLDYWEETPAGILYINYLPTAEAKAILKAGQRATKKEGALAGLKVGNH